MAEIRVSLVLENAYDAIAARSGRAAAAAVRRVETIGVIDMGNDRAATPLCVPEDIVRRLGLEEGERQWDGRLWAGPITLRIGDRHTCGDCVGRPIVACAWARCRCASWTSCRIPPARRCGRARASGSKTRSCPRNRTG